MSYKSLISDTRNLLKGIVETYPIMASYYGPAGYDWNGSRKTNPAGIGSFVFLDETLDLLYRRLVYNLQFIFDNLKEDREPVWAGDRYKSRGESEIFYTLNGYANVALQLEEFTPSKEEKWTPHYDLYYVRSHLYDLLPKANSGETYLSPVITQLRLNLEKICKKYWDEYKEWVKTATGTETWTATVNVNGTPTQQSGSYSFKWYQGGTFPNKTSQFAVPKWGTYTTDDGGAGTGTTISAWTGSVSGNNGAILIGGTLGPSSSLPSADRYFWTSAKAKAAHDEIVSNVASLLQSIMSDFNIISTTIIDICALMEEYANRYAACNQFIMDEKKHFMEDGAQAAGIWKDIDKSGFNLYNDQVAYAYELFIKAGKAYDQYFPEKVNERQQLMSKLAQSYIMSDLNFWNLSWQWYSKIRELRRKRNI